MPLELGIAMARRHMGKSSKRQHDWLLLVPDDHQYFRFVSDLAGFDPLTHDGTVATVVPRVMRWLASRPNSIPTPTPRDVLAALPAFQAKRRQLGIDWIGDVPWSHVLVAAEENVPKL
jgi:hypothetical protein